MVTATHQHGIGGGGRPATAHHCTYKKGRRVGDMMDLTKCVNDGMSRWIGREKASLLMRYSWRCRVKARPTAMLRCNCTGLLCTYQTAVLCE